MREKIEFGLKKKKLRMLDIKEKKKDYLLSVKRLKLKRERHVDQGEKDYAHTHTHTVSDR